MKKIFTLAVLMISVLGVKSQTGTNVVISQVYGAGGNSGATFNADFVELFNPTASSINITGWSVQYASATGTSWQVAAITGVNLAPGQYYLVQMSAAGANGSALPPPDHVASPAIAMAAAAGKVALVNNITALSGTQCPTMAASIVDFVGFGSTANCFEGTGPTPAPSATLSATRAGTGCTDANNNAADFTAVTPAPRNTATVLAPCGGGGSANLNASPPVLNNFQAGFGNASNSQSFTLSGTNLSGAPVSVTPSAGYEISTDNINFTTAPINIPYAGGTLAATTIYVRIAAFTTQGAVTGNVTASGGGAAANAVVTLNGAVYLNFYSKSAGNLDQLSTWGTNPDGTGTSPSAFTNPYQWFNVVNQTNATIGGDWDVTGSTNKIIVGNGVAPVTFTIPATFAVAATSIVDVTNNATLLMLSNIRPTLGTLATGSTVNYAQTGLSNTDTIKIQTIPYHHLKLTNGIKYLSSGTTIIRGTFTVDGVQNFNGAASPFSTINSFGDITLLNGTTFEPVPTGDNARITLAMNSSSTQTISGNGSTLMFFRLRRDTLTSNGNIVLAPGTNLVLGNNSGGGLQLVQGAATTTTLNLGSNALTFVGQGASTTTSLGKISVANGSIHVNKSLGTADAGTLRFTSGSVLDQFTINLGAPVTKDSVTIADNVLLEGDLNLTKGKIVMSSGAVLALTNSALVNGGSATSFVDGKMSKTGNTDFTYHVGKGPEYSQMEIRNPGAVETFTVQYFNTAHPTTTIDPTTQATYPAYNISRKEYWTVDRAGTATADLIFYYDAHSQPIGPFDVRIAHFDGTDWNDLGGTPSGTPGTGFVRVNGVSTFSPFTFAAALNVVPITVSTFTVQKISNAVKLSWNTEQEIRSSSFIIERSPNGRTWEVINTLPAAGNSNSKVDYFISDNTPFSGLNYYRIKAVDMDGKFAYSVVRAVSMTKEVAMIVSPNPAKDFINVNYLRTNSGPITVTLADANGKTVMQTKTTESIIRLDLRNVGKGTYLVYVIDGDKVSSEKVLIQ